MTSKKLCQDGSCGYGCGPGFCCLARLDPEEFFRAIENEPPELQRDVRIFLAAARNAVNGSLDAVQKHFVQLLPNRKLAFLENDRGRVTLGFVRVDGPETDIELDNPPDDN
jgi:hypothetical protein